MLNPLHKADTVESADPQIIRLDTLPDIVRKLRRITDDIGANHFVAYFATPRPGRQHLAVCLDAHYPGVAEETGLLTTTLGDRFARRIAASSVPLYWAQSLEPFGTLHADLGLVERMEPPAGSTAGLALPAAVEHGAEGAIVFTGAQIRLSTEMLCDLHARCIGLFGVIAKLKPVTGDHAPSISKRELECLMLTANGLTSEEIAARLGLSVHTANQYLTNTTRKLNAMNRTQAVAKALRMGLFD